MITQSTYIPIIKTGEAELRAINSITPEVKNAITPLFELTRGRKSPKEDEGTIARNLEFLKKNFKDNTFLLDITGESDLSNSEINLLHLNENNYKNWVDFCIEQKKYFKQFYPVIQVEEEEDYDIYIDKLTEQVKTLAENFDYIVFRSQSETMAHGLISDIKTIIDSEKIPDFSKKIIYILDYRYINNAEKGIETAAKFIEILNKLEIKKIAISSTSFPANVSEYMDENDKNFKIKEIDFFKNIKNQPNINKIDIIYSDYASINPVRNDVAVFARGWIPRIDIPAEGNYIYCSRKRREKTNSYADEYVLIARRVINRPYFQSLDNLNIDCWGKQEVINTANNNVSGSSPRFWISVRMNIYLSYILKKLSVIYL